LKPVTATVIINSSQLEIIIIHEASNYVYYCRSCGKGNAVHYNIQKGDSLDPCRKCKNEYVAGETIGKIKVEEGDESRRIEWEAEQKRNVLREKWRAEKRQMA